MLIAETARLQLRELTLDDAAFVLAALNDPDFVRKVIDRGVRTLDDARRYLQEGPLAAYAQHGHALWCVVRKSDGALMGLCGIIRREGLPDPDVGYTFLPEYRGQGYAREAAQASLDYGRNVLRLPRITAIVDAANTGSIRVLEAIGLRHEGELFFGEAQALKLLYA